MQREIEIHLKAFKEIPWHLLSGKELLFAQGPNGVLRDPRCPSRMSSTIDLQVGYPPVAAIIYQ
jgi:hypothetical protein